MSKTSLMVLRLTLVLMLLGSVGVRAQDIPVEVEMRLPPTAVEAASRASWRPPPALCPLCHQPRTERGCDCDRMLEGKLATELREQVGLLARQAFQGRLELPQGVVVRVVSPQVLEKRAGAPAEGLYEDGVIWLNHDLNRRQALGVLAHEMAHAWQYRHHVDAARCSEAFREGFAAWVAYHVLLEAGDRSGAERLEHGQERVYEFGLSSFLELERQQGQASVLERACRDGAF